MISNVADKYKDVENLASDNIKNAHDIAASGVHRATDAVVDVAQIGLDQGVNVVHGAGDIAKASVDKVRNFELDGFNPGMKTKKLANFKDIISPPKTKLQKEKDVIDEETKKFDIERRQHYEKNKQTLSKYDVEAIEFSWLFEDHPRKMFLESLSETKELEFFSLPLIQNVLMFLWRYYKIVIYIFILIPFLVYFIAFILYATWINKQKAEEEDGNGRFHRANIALIVVICIGIGMSIILEFNKIIYSILEYLTSFWNLVNFCSIGLNIAVVTTDLSEISKRDFVPLLAVAVLFMWIKLFYFGRVFLSTAWMVRMIYAIFANIGHFLFILAIMIIGFANVFYIEARIENTRFAGPDFWRALMHSYE